MNIAHYFIDKKYRLNNNLSAHKISLIHMVSKLIDAEKDTANNNSMYRMAPDMLSSLEKQKIRFQIFNFEGVNIEEISSKDRLYQIFQNYIYDTPSAYLLYTVKGSVGFIYIFDESFELIATQSISSSTIILEPLQITPIDWLKIRDET